MKGLLQFQKSFFCYIYQPSRRRRVFNYIIRAKRRPSPEVLPAWSCFRLATAALSCALSIGKDLMAKRVLYYQLAPLLYEPDPRNQVPPSLEWGWSSYEISLAAQFFSQCRTSLLELCFSRQGAMWRFNTPKPGVLLLAPPPTLVIKFDSSPSTALPACSPHCLRHTPLTYRGLGFSKNILKTASLSLRCWGFILSR